MSLKKFHALFVLFTLSILLLLYLYIEQLLQNNIDMQIENGIVKHSVDIREMVREKFDALIRKFALYEKTNLMKLQDVADYVSENPDEMNLSAIGVSLNTNLIDGRYEISVINKEKVVEKSSSAAEIGLDFKKYPYFSKVLDRLKSGTKGYEITAPVFDRTEMDMRQYFIVSEGDDWVVLDHILHFDDYDHQNIEALRRVYPSLTDLDLYILTADNIQYINKRQQAREGFTSYAEQNRANMVMIASQLGLQQQTSPPTAAMIIDDLKERDMVYRRNDELNEATVYTLTNNYQQSDADTFALIAKMRFDLNYHLNKYQELKNILRLFISFVLIYAVLSFILIYGAVISKITSIAQHVRSDRIIVIDGFLFSEFKYLIQRYNKFLLHWKGEVRRLNEITMQDELTKCANRRYFNKKLKEEIDLFYRYGQEFSMIMLDIDDFKKINDVHGHDAGDHVLFSIAEDIRQQVRTSDSICRIGGEEFAIILPETDYESAFFVAEKIRAGIEKQEYIEDETITVSVGVGSFQDGQDFNGFYQAVDSLLYFSKSSGKNRVQGGMIPTV